MANIKKGEKTTSALMELYKNGSIEARDKIIAYYIPRVEIWAKEYFDLGIEKEDIISSGYEGLLIALTRYKEKSLSGINISNYIKLITINTIKNYISRYYGILKNNREKTITINILKIMRNLTRKLNREPSIEEIKENTNYELEDIENALNIINKIKPKDLTNMTLEELCEVKKSVIDPEFMEVYKYFKENIISYLDKILSKEIDKEIIKLRMINGKSYKEISKMYNISRERVVQIEAKAIRIIKKSQYIQRLAENLGEQTERNAIENEIVYRKLPNRVNQQ